MSPTRVSLYALSFLSLLHVAVGGTCTPPPTASKPSEPEVPQPTSVTPGALWQPAVGSTWQIVLEYSLNSTSYDASVYDIDLFDNSASTIAELHSLGRKVICYFSAGSYENWRDDAKLFTKDDYKNPLDGWDGENWINTKSPNVRKLMNARMEVAKSKGCDGVDPDNIDAYDNDNGMGLTKADAVDYVKFLAGSASTLGMSIGLKNSGDIAKEVLPLMQWSVNEQCAQYGECDVLQPFIKAGKPVFQIEYPKSAPSITPAQKSKICDNKDSVGFSTVLKELDLGNWIDAC